MKKRRYIVDWTTEEPEKPAARKNRRKIGRLRPQPATKTIGAAHMAAIKQE